MFGKNKNELDKKEIKGLEKKAAASDLEAIIMLGNWYNEGVKQDYKEAVKYYKLTVEKGLAQAQYNLGICYTNGQGVSQDERLAQMWFKKAEDQGYK